MVCAGSIAAPVKRTVRQPRPRIVSPPIINDPVAQALWQAHVERALLSARKLKGRRWPAPVAIVARPDGIRALWSLILVVASFLPPAASALKRVAAAFDWHGVVVPANFRIDAWVTPPVYTGRPPVMLTGLRPGETAQAAARMAVPVGSSIGGPCDRQGAL